MELVLNTEAIQQAGEAAEESQAIAVCAQELHIVNAEQYEEAAEILKEIKGRLKQLETKRKWFTEPLLEMKKRTDSLFKGPSNSLKQAESAIKKGMVAYSQETERKRLELEQKARELAASEAATVAEVHDVLVEAVTRGVTPKVSGVVVKKVTKFEISDPNLLPRKFLKPNEAAIRNAVRGGGEIPGVRVWQEDQISAGSR